MLLGPSRVIMSRHSMVRPWTILGQARWRNRAFEWLQADLAILKRQLAPSPAPRAVVQQKLHAWCEEKELAGLREPRELAKLPPADRAAWLQFWHEVRSTLALSYQPEPDAAVASPP
jgi:hypothetical protein